MDTFAVTAFFLRSNLPTRTLRQLNPSVLESFVRFVEDTQPERRCQRDVLRLADVELFGVGFAVIALDVFSDCGVCVGAHRVLVRPR